MMSFRKTILLASSAVAFATTAHAQEAGEARLEEVVVTAQRRFENLQDVPIAISAVTAATAEKLGINDPASVSQIVPGFTLPRQANTATPFMRGVGSNSGFIGNEPSVATFIDEVYVPNTGASAFEFNNIDSIEVLKGPQGTLFGRNATGGVLHIRTRNPTQRPTMDIAGTYGNYDTYTGQFYGSTGITDTVSANLAAYVTEQKDGWGKNVVTGRDSFTMEGWGVRSKVLIEPSDVDSILLFGAYDFRKSGQGVSMRANPGLFSTGGYSIDRAGGGFYDVSANFDDGYKNSYAQIGAKVKHDFDNATLISITAYSKLRSKSQIDSDTTPASVLNVQNNAKSHTFTEELQLVSNTDGPLTWILGGFYLFDRSEFDGRFFGAAIPGGATQRTLTTQTTDSFSGFAQSSFEFLPDTRMTLGVRYTSDTRRLTGNVSLGATNGPAARVKRTFSNLTGRAALDHKFSDNVMAYVAYNRGFKSGVYNLPSAVTLGGVVADAVLPEDLNAYSAGFKSEFWDKRVRLNGEAWFYDYKNIQVVNQIPAGQRLTNAGAARIKGFDIDFTVLPVTNLTLTAAVAVADGHYTKFPGGPFFFQQAPNAPTTNRPPGCVTAAGVAIPDSTYPTGTSPSVQIACDLKGKKTIQTIPLSVNLSATYKIPTAVGDFDAAISWAHGGDYFNEPSNDPASYQAKQDIINASLQWTSTNDAFAVRVWGRNLGQEKYFSYTAGSSTSNQKYAPAAPRTYGVTLSAHY